jgi:predicted nucleotidyltransferase
LLNRIDEDLVVEAVNRILAAAPGSEVIVFGSRGRGDARESSDLDLLVIEPAVQSEHDEMVRLSDVLRPMRIAVDVIVVSRRLFNEWADTPGTVIYKAAHEGKRFKQVA